MLLSGVSGRLIVAHFFPSNHPKYTNTDVFVLSAVMTVILAIGVGIVSYRSGASDIQAIFNDVKEAAKKVANGIIRI